MRKRRRLADKLTIMVCAVLLAVSAFFYAPMVVEASSASATVSSTKTSLSEYYYIDFPSTEVRIIDFQDFSESQFTADGYYRITFDCSLDITASRAVRLRRYFLTYKINDSEHSNIDYIYNYVRYPDENSASTKYFSSSQTSCVIFGYGSALNNVVVNFDGLALYDGSSGVSTSLTLVHSISNVSVESISSMDADEYENGYNAGYSAGESAGYGNGYSNGFADGEASVDTDAIYDEAFQAGKDSVDTQSYYDAGYQAGYDAAYSAGYESGYDVGYQLAMDRIANWGADTLDYPKQIYSYDMGHTFSTNVTYNIPFLYRDSVKGYLSNVHLNPNHTYRFDVEIYPHDWDSADTITYENEFYFCIGGIDYPLAYFSTNSFLTSLFVPGDRMSDSYYLVWSTIRASVDGTNNICRVVCPYTITLYDVGPSGDTQNHIANQTDQLTNGFDESQGNSVNSDLSTGLNEYQTAEDSLWATATTGLKDFTFFDFESVPAMITGMSFITSIMGSWFSHAGGASGVGIVLSILFSVMLVAMVLGLYRLYQSKGGKK